AGRLSSAACAASRTTAAAALSTLRQSTRRVRRDSRTSSASSSAWSASRCICLHTPALLMRLRRRARSCPRTRERRSRASLPRRAADPGLYRVRDEGVGDRQKLRVEVSYVERCCVTGLKFFGHDDRDRIGGGCRLPARGLTPEQLVAAVRGRRQHPPPPRGFA